MITSDFMHLAWAQTWQLTALIVVTYFVTRFVGKRQPHLAHVLWLVVLAKSLTPPVIASAGGVFSWLQPAPEAASAGAEQGGAFPSRETPSRNGEQIGSIFAAFETTPDGASPGAAVLSQVEFAGGMTGPDPASVPNSDTMSTWIREAAGLCGWGWMAGSITLFLAAMFRWGAAIRKIRAATIVERPELELLVAELSQRLRLEKNVRLIVTESRLGPAVVGFLHPVILLPAAVVRGKSARELEAILAHELIHVRRGDLWIGLVQLVSQAVWWFHPLMWLASRRATRAAEACCDEEVVAELGCDPASYASSLLDVLELKRRLASVPAFPGMKPVDVTRERLERIMQSGQGCRRTTPWWCWVVLVLTAAVTLPGAALLVSAEKSPKQNEENLIPVSEPESRSGKSAIHNAATDKENEPHTDGEALEEPSLKNLKELKGTGILSSAGLVGMIVLADDKKAEESQFASPAAKQVLKPKQEMCTVTYSVADLIIPRTPLHLELWPADDSKPADRSQMSGDVDSNINRALNPYRVHQMLPGERQPRESRKANFAPLIELIQATTGQDRWNGVGDVGSIRPFEQTLSLVVRNTPQVHDEIAGLLRQLRRLHSLQAMLHLELYHVPNGSSKVTMPDVAFLESAKRGLIPTKDQLDQLRVIIHEAKGTWITEHIKFMVQNGQGVELALRLLQRQKVERPPLMQLGMAIAPDRSAVRLHIAVGAENTVDALARSRPHIIKDRQPLLLDVTDDIKSGRLGLPALEPFVPGKLAPITVSTERRPGGERTLILITPEIVVLEAEESLPTPTP